MYIISTSPYLSTNPFEVPPYQVYDFFNYYCYMCVSIFMDKYT